MKTFQISNESPKRKLTIESDRLQINSLFDFMYILKFVHFIFRDLLRASLSNSQWSST